MATQTKNRRLDIRVRPDEDALIRAAAERRSQTVSEFLVESAIARAEIELTEHTHFVLTGADWDAFVSALDRPPGPIERMADLFD